MRISFPIDAWIFGCFSFLLLRTLRIQEGQMERERELILKLV